MDEQQSVWEAMEQVGMEKEDEAAAYLLTYGLPKEILEQKIHALSGGEKNLLQLAILSLGNASLLLMDEPTSALDPISTGKIEELCTELCKSTTIVIVTHNMQQAARVSDKTAFFYLGQMVEFDDTKKIFTNPDKVETQNYITGRFG